jgi:hypothetical protein
VMLAVGRCRVVCSNDSRLRQRTVSLSSLRVWKTIPVSARSKAYVCGRWLAGIVGSNTAGGMDVCCECCVLSGRDVCDCVIIRPEESFRVWGD